MTWLSSDDDWPAHQRPEVQKALTGAKEAGWLLKPLSGHGFAWLNCPFEEHEGRCKIQVYTTGSGDKSGTATALIIRRRLKQCEKQLPSIEQETVQSKVRDLERLGELLDHAMALRESREAAARADRIYDHAVEPDSEADQEEANSEIGEELELSERLETKAWAGATSFGLGEPWPPEEGAQTLIDAARERFYEVVDALETDDIPGELEVAIDTLKSRFDELGVEL